MNCFSRYGLLLVAFCAGLVLTHHVCADEPSQDPPDLGLGIFSNPWELRCFSIEAVRKELGLSDKQVSEIDKQSARFKAESAAFGKSVTVGAAKPVSDEDQKRIRDFSAKMSKRTDDGLREILSKPQLQRVQQIALQMATGPSVISRPPLADILKLNDGQRSELTNLQRKWWEERRANAKAADGAKESFEEASARLEKQTAEILTQEQRRRLQELKGPTADAVIAEIRVNFAKWIQSAVEREKAKRAAARDSESRKPESTPSDKN